ncbi:MFS transporter [Amycolatopsis sp. cg13]|uniref:MFS transporter n=1 Tax=Amycolatopsis sp. cg13 TaxID=3238807 RepID=UPI003525D1BF
MSIPAPDSPATRENPPEEVPSPRSSRIVLAATIGNTLEWFSLGAYTLFADVLAKQFFPATDPAVSLMLAFASVAVAYVIRPFGGMILGSYADRVGRKAALVVSIRIMAVASLLIAIMPNYATIGIAAPLGLVFANLLQGFSAGGEFGSATAYLVESNRKRRGFMGSWGAASQGLSTLLGIVFAAVLSAVLTDQQLGSWGWRIPFAFGLLIAPIGYYLRRHVEESPAFEEEAAEAPLREVLRSQKTRILVAMGAMAVSTAISYLIIYMPTFAIRNLGLPKSLAFTTTIVTQIVLTVLAPVAGRLSDRTGRIPLMAAACSVMLLAIFPLFLALNSQPTFAVMTAVMAAIGLVKVWYVGPLGTMMADVFPTRTRATGLSVSYNITASLFGGFTPLVVIWLIQLTGSNLAPSYYVMALAVLSLSALAFARRRLRVR